MICDYGCGQEATHQFKNGKWCCSKNVSQCNEVKRKLSKFNTGKQHTERTKIKMSKSQLGRFVSEKTKRKLSKSLQGHKVSEETRKKISLSNKGKSVWNIGIPCNKETKKKISESNSGKMRNKKQINQMKTSSKLSIDQIKKRYQTFSKIEEMRYKPGYEKEKEIQVHCKNHLCPNSKEQGGWFTPTGIQLTERIRNIERPRGIGGGGYFYCCDECKDECPLFNKKISTLIKQDQINAGRIKEDLYTYEEYQTFRQQVLKREDYLCEYCDKPAIDVHHSRPQKLEPDFGVACCESCHYKYGHKDECSTGNLATKVCV